MHKLFATCPKDLESLLAQELATLGASAIKETRAGVNFEASLSDAYRICLWSRLANQVLLPLKAAAIHDVDSLYQIARHFPWEEHTTAENTFALDADLINAPLKNHQYVIQRFKDGLVDYWREHTQHRPTVQTLQPQCRFHLLIKKNELTLSLNLSGESLHKRGFRIEGGSAPLKENLAAAILIRAGWPEIAVKGGSLFDPMCGSGTLLIEAAFIAGDIAPGLSREYFGFLHWQEFKPVVWKNLLKEAQERREAGLLKLPKIIGYDADRSSIRMAQENIARAHLSAHIHVERRDLSQCKALTVAPGLVITNPPYGQRLGEKETLKFTYQHLGEMFKKEFSAWRCSIFTGNPDLAKALRLGPEKIYQFFNGAIPCQLLNFVIRPQQAFAEETPLKNEIAAPNEGKDFANRLQKNMAKLEPLAKKADVQCYRLYDADLPDYAVAIDRYENFVHLQEYAPPKTIDPAKAEKRLQLALQHTAHILQVPMAKIFVKTRQKQKGKNQYEKQAGKSTGFFTIHEGPAKFLVNFTDYLDTGLFLDARQIRQYIFEHAKGKSFLNLFCYTGSATVYAALGKAASTTSVDMSATYLAWAKRNLALNGFSPHKHQFIQADCLQWLKENKQKFELILLDPPTFSNSKRMEGTLDIQRDHAALISLVMQHLTKTGALIFVTNKNNFKLDSGLQKSFSVKNMTEKTLPFDFKRHPAHQAYLFSFAST